MLGQVSQPVRQWKGVKIARNYPVTHTHMYTCMDICIWIHIYPVSWRMQMVNMVIICSKSKPAHNAFVDELHSKRDSIREWRPCQLSVTSCSSWYPSKVSACAQEALAMAISALTNAAYGHNHPELAFKVAAAGPLQ